MAKVLKEIFSPTDKINQTFTIQSWHVSQSVDALTGVDEYDITISGSLTLTGSAYLEGTPSIGGNTSNILVIDSTTNQVKYGVDPSTLGGDAQTGSLLTTASLTGTDLEFTKGDGSTFTIDIATAEAQDLQNVTSLGNRTSSSIQIGPDPDPGTLTKDGLYYLDIGSATPTGAGSANIIWSTSRYNLVIGYTNSIRGHLSGVFGKTNEIFAGSSSSLAVGVNNEIGSSLTGANNSFALGTGNTTTGDHSFSQGNTNTASGNQSHAQGTETQASGNSSHAEGNNTRATAGYSHAEGKNTLASGISSHAEGLFTTASAWHSHAEGRSTRASAWGSHAEGTGSWASGSYSHTEGIGTEASQLSTAMGIYTKAYGITTFPPIPRWADSGPWNPIDPEISSSGQHLFGAQLVIGRYNEPKNDQLFIIGNGTDDNDRTNVMEVSLTDVNFYYPITSSADISSSGDLTINNLIVNTSITASSISASSIIGDVSASAAGNTTEVQFNNGGIFGASPNLTWNYSDQVLTIKGGTSTYPSLFLTTVANDLNKGDIMGRIEAFNTQESGQTFNPGLRFVADADWESAVYNSRIEFQTVNGFTESTQLLISSSGQLKFNSYGNETFTGTPSTYLASDSSGNIIEITNPNNPSEPSTFTSLDISDYFYQDLNGWDIQFIDGSDPTLNGRISINNADPSLVTQLKIARDNTGTIITSITKITKGSVIYMKTSDNTPSVTYIAESDIITGGSPSFPFYTVDVRPQTVIGGDNWQAGDGLTIFQIDNPINETLTTGYHKCEISYDSNIGASFSSDLLVKFRCDQSNNVGDTTLIEYKGISTNNDSGFDQYAQLQYQTISASVEADNAYLPFHNNFDTGSGFITLMTVQSGSRKGFMLLGNNQYV